MVWGRGGQLKLNASPMLVVHCTSRVMLSLPVTVSQKMGLMGGSIWARGPERLARGRYQ